MMWSLLWLSMMVHQEKKENATAAHYHPAP
jgi:hypothetical protein